jgi:hypothetical protein
MVDLTAYPLFRKIGFSVVELELLSDFAKFSKKVGVR